jgi:hypothetical protein
MYHKQMGLKLDETRQLLACTDACKEGGLEVNSEETKYRLMSRHQNERHIKTVNRSFENVVQLKYLRKTVRNQNLIQEKIKTILDSSNVCYNSVQNLLSSRLLSKNLKIRL